MKGKTLKAMENCEKLGTIEQPIENHRKDAKAKKQHDAKTRSLALAAANGFAPPAFQPKFFYQAGWVIQRGTRYHRWLFMAKFILCPDSTQNS